MRVAIGADHAGYRMKEELRPFVADLGHEVLDKGTYSDDSVDYPDFAKPVAEAVRDGEADRGIILCGSGVGACVVANKINGVRAGLCHDTYSARQGVEHDDVNVLCLGSRVIGIELARALVTAFLDAEFSREERHQRRLGKVLRLESGS